MPNASQFTLALVDMLLTVAETEEELIVTMRETTIGLWIAPQAQDVLERLSPAEVQAGEAHRERSRRRTSLLGLDHLMRWPDAPKGWGFPPRGRSAGRVGAELVHPGWTWASGRIRGLVSLSPPRLPFSWRRRKEEIAA